MAQKDKKDKEEKSKSEKGERGAMVMVIVAVKKSTGTYGYVHQVVPRDKVQETVQRLRQQQR